MLGVVYAANEEMNEAMKLYIKCQKSVSAGCVQFQSGFVVGVQEYFWAYVIQICRSRWLLSFSYSATNL